MKKFKKVLLVIVLIIIFSTITFFIGRKIGLNTNTSSTSTVVTEEIVSKHTIKKELTASGEIDTAKTEQLELNTNRYFEMLCVEEDDTVEEGENILEYTNGTYLVAPYDCVISSTSVPEADEVVAVQINAVTTRDDKNYVTIINNGNTEEVEVELGIADDEYVQITSGVEENDIIQITTTTTQSEIRNSAEEENSRGNREQSGSEMPERGMGGEMPDMSGASMPQDMPRGGMSE